MVGGEIWLDVSYKDIKRDRADPVPTPFFCSGYFLAARSKSVSG